MVASFRQGISGAGVAVPHDKESAALTQAQVLAAVEFVRNSGHFWNKADWVTLEFAQDLLRASGLRLPGGLDVLGESNSKER